MCTHASFDICFPFLFAKDGLKLMTLKTRTSTCQVGVVNLLLSFSKTQLAIKYFNVFILRPIFLFFSPGLPPDISTEEFAEIMSKCGIVMRDPITEEYKVKLYKDKDGNLKGDGLCCYLKVSQVITLRNRH